MGKALHLVSKDLGLGPVLLVESSVVSNMLLELLGLGFLIIGLSQQVASSNEVKGREVSNNPLISQFPTQHTPKHL